MTYCTYNNIDQIIKNIKTLDINITQFDNNTLTACLNSVSFENILLYHTQFNVSTEQYHQNNKNMYYLQINLLENEFIVNGYNLSTNQVAIIKPTDCITTIHKKYSNTLTIQLPKSVIVKYFESLETGIYNVTSLEVLDEFKQLSLKLITTKINDKSYIKEYNSLIKELLSCINLQKKKQHKYHLQFQNISEFIKKNYKHNLSINAISQKFDISDRTLRNIFLHQIGIPPKQYLKLFIINQFKKELVLNPEKNITDSMLENGLEFQSLVAKDFKFLFGTTPSKFKEKFLT